MESIENYIRKDSPVLTPLSGLEEACQLFRSKNVSQITDEIPFVLRFDMGIGYCFQLMTKHKTIQLPSVDDKGCYVGDLFLNELPLDQ